MEELQSHDSKAAAYAYDTFHGTEQRMVVMDHRKRIRSWSDQHQEEGEDHCVFARRVNLLCLKLGPSI